MFMYNEHHQKMNKTEQTVLAAAITTLSDLGLVATADPGKRSRQRQSDATITIRRDARTCRFEAEIKPALRWSMVGLLTAAFETATDARRLVITDYVTPQIADELRNRDIQFVDAAGNAYINCDGLFVFVSGRRPEKIATPPRPPRVFQATGIKVLFAILSAPQLLETQRSIASAAGVALGSVPVVLEGLTELGYLVEAGGTRRLVNRDRLVQQWTEAYARVLEPSLHLAHFSAASDWWRNADLIPHGAQWGGETAAAILHRSLVPERSIVYVDEVSPRLVSQYRLKSDPAGRVVLRRRFWNAVPSPREDIVPPLLIYADLMVSGDARSIDSARQVRDAWHF